jgi:gliding motility-associated lipoprotein GldH
MKKNCNSFGVAILVGVLLFSACSSHTVFQDNEAIPASGWHLDNIIDFGVTIDDTVRLHELYLMVRNTTNYPYSNLFLFLDIEFPDHRILRDTIECILAHKDGQWTGKGFGTIRSNQFLFRDDVWFPLAGTYTFRIQHGMREEHLKGMADIGIRIERK